MSPELLTAYPSRPRRSGLKEAGGQRGRGSVGRKEKGRMKGGELRDEKIVWKRREGRR